MVKMTAEEWRRVADAIVVWSGWGRGAQPHRNDESLVRHLGRQEAANLLPVVRELVDDFYSSDARYTAADLPEMARLASEQFLRKHPDSPDEAVRALAWCYTFDYK